ncbi:MAG: cadmium-translocating P-type ATPase, partial [Oscillospiraceae bacterium]|nr:cadmium-translocating P-type ATPase [Oscillospiraceae bacterium]
MKGRVIRIGAALTIFVVGLFLDGWYQAGFVLAAWIVAGYDVLWSALRNILRGQIFDENFLMALATVCALAMQEWREAAAVMIFYQVGALFEDLAVRRSRTAISALTELRPDIAIVLRDGAEVEVLPEELNVGDVLLVRPGDRIAVDGVIVEGESSLDTSGITGESLPAEVCPGSKVISGCVNLSGVLKIRAESAYEHSTVARILSLVDEAAEKKASTERMITRFARWYTPCVIGAAVLLAAIPPLLFQQPFRDWLYRALTFLVISCPCALVISVPMSFFGGMGAAAKLGVVVKGGAALEQLARGEIIAFDKTGTLTSGDFSVRSVHAYGAAEAEVLRLAALCEQHSTHPIATAVRGACPAPEGTVEDLKNQAGFGITGREKGVPVAIGSSRLMEQLGVEVPPPDATGTVLYVARAGKCIGAIVVGDSLREETVPMLRAVKTRGIRKTVMLTGDREETAARFAALCGVDTYRARLLPQEKVDCLRALRQESRGAVIYCGDGMNDAPLLAAADVGIAMGGIGSEAAIETADVVMLKDDIGAIPDLLRIARRTCAISVQNIVFVLAVKGVCLVLGALGYAP